MTGIVGDTHGPLEEIYLCCGCVAAFQSTCHRSIRAGRVQSGASKKKQARQTKKLRGASLLLLTARFDKSS